MSRNKEVTYIIVDQQLVTFIIVDHFGLIHLRNIPGSEAQALMCLSTDSGVASLILARSHTFMEICHEIISTAILLPSPDSRRVVVSYKRKYVHEVLVNCLVKLAQKKSVVR